MADHRREAELVRDPAEVPAPPDELPVVARLVVEIRSDGRRTVARGVMEDSASGERVAVEARGDSPLRLAWELARGIARGPVFARAAARGLLRSVGRRRRPGTMPRWRGPSHGS